VQASHHGSELIKFSTPLKHLCWNIACGISGAFQHVSGIRGARTIVAISTDSHAAIFRVAHYCIVEDLTTFIPILIEELSAECGSAF